MHFLDFYRGTNLEKLQDIRWKYVALIVGIATIGFLTLFSAGGGHLSPWANQQMGRFIAGMIVMLLVAVSDQRFWLRHAYTFYVVSLVLLMVVAVMGRVGMGARRWLDLYVIQLQPSELMKIALVLTLARYFHDNTLDEIRRFRHFMIPLLIVSLPAVLVMKQPDLGTAVLLLLIGLSTLFIVGIRFRYFLTMIGTIGAAAPFLWHFLKDYQKKRILTFIDPNVDPLGSGYHILQSKIALGSGGIFGKGFLKGTQSHLNFLPEKQTDFIFTMYSEEFGFVGSLLLLGLYAALIFWGYVMTLGARSSFGRIVGFGITTSIFIYVSINVAMVMGLVPVVGVPLPLVSYGGSAMMTLLFGFGLLLNIDAHRDERLK